MVITRYVSLTLITIYISITNHSLRSSNSYEPVQSNHVPEATNYSNHTTQNNSHTTQSSSYNCNIETAPEVHLTTFLHKSQDPQLVYLYTFHLYHSATLFTCISHLVHLYQPPCSPVSLVPHWLSLRLCATRQSPLPLLPTIVPTTAWITRRPSRPLTLGTSRDKAYLVNNTTTRDVLYSDPPPPLIPI